MITLDGREVKVGDRLWSILSGWVTVEAIIADATYSIRTTNGSYSSGGKWLDDHVSRTLFWGEVKINPPSPPKRKVRKWQWLVAPECASPPYVTHTMYTKEGARSVYGNQAIRPIEETMIEVEE